MCNGVRSHLIEGARFGEASVDLAGPESAGELMAAATASMGRVQILVCNHAASGRDGSIFDMTSALLDGHWSVNTRSTILLTTGLCGTVRARAHGGPHAAGGKTAPNAAQR